MLSWRFDSPDLHNPGARIVGPRDPQRLVQTRPQDTASDRVEVGGAGPRPADRDQPEQR